MFNKLRRKILVRIHFLFYGLDKANMVSSHLSVDEKIALFKLAKSAKGNFVEIGSYLGGSSCFIADGIRKSGADSKLYCIDTWKNNAMTEGERDTYEEFVVNTTDYCDLLAPIRETSENAINILKKHIEFIDFLFVDADHGYSGVKRDWDLYSPLLKSGSVVVFHDYGWAEGVKKVVNEDVKPLISKENALPNMWWGFVK